LDNRELKKLLHKYRQGTTSKKESDALEQWLDRVKNPDHAHFDDEFIEQRLIKTKAKVNAHINQSGTFYRHTIIRIATAATLLLFSAIAVIWGLSGPKLAGKKFAAQQSVEYKVSNGWIYWKTAKGVRQTIKLSDGSIIVLNASSRLHYPKKFTNHKRPVYLDEGEALFTVAKDKKNPFTVYTAKFATTALGTAFNIRSYQKENKVSISLIHGKIAVHDMLATKKTGAIKILLPHQQLVADLHSIKSASFNDETTVTGWVDGVLSFKDASMAEVLNGIENRFGVSIINHSKHTDWSYTGIFKTETLKEVLETICLTENINYSLTDNEITIY
jgi:ferric-dicitrate binding protein FerR (iron transport regulator)